MREHSFKRIPNSLRVDQRTRAFVERYHCKQCDSIVQYPSSYTESDVNHRVDKSVLKCLPPVDYKDYADTDYHSKKYEKKEKK